ncbi:hypothetical protein D3C77_580080 [compost metagenome]
MAPCTFSQRAQNHMGILFQDWNCANGSDIADHAAWLSRMVISNSNHTSECMDVNVSIHSVFSVRGNYSSEVNE